MFSRFRTFFVTVISGFAAIAVCYGLWIWTCSMGHDELVTLARERSLCQTADCDEGGEQAAVLVGTHLSMYPETVKWCIGVDTWRATRVYRGGLFKMILVDVMDVPCGALHKPKDVATTE